MAQIFVDDCPACEPVNRLIGILLENGFDKFQGLWEVVCFSVEN